MCDVVDLASYKKQKEKERFDELLKEEFAFDDFADGFSEDVVYDIIELLEENGVYVDANAETVFDILLILESVKSLIYRSTDREHPLQDVPKFLFNVENPEELMDEILS